MSDKNISLYDLVLLLLQKKALIVCQIVVVFLVAVIISLFLPKYYKSSVVFIPPGQSSSSIFSMLGDNFAGDFLNDSKFSKRQYIALLNSRELREQLIQKFDLVKVYKLKKRKNGLDLTLRALEKNIRIAEKEEGGLGITDVISVEVTVIDRNAQQASDMANYLFELLEKKNLELLRRDHAQQIEFLTHRIQLNDSLLIESRQQLKSFQINNKLYDPSSQLKLTVSSLAQLEAEKLSLELQKTYLQKSFAPGNIEANILNDKIAGCNQKITDLEQEYSSNLRPGLRKSLILSDEFADRLKEVETYLRLNLLLREQLELARIKFQKSFSGLCLVDHARPAQYKFKPKRAVFVLIISFLYGIGLISWIILMNFYSYAHRQYPDQMSRFSAALRL
jgi:capsule polysaccharide export protein KpsE/RkpR